MLFLISQQSELYHFVMGVFGILVPLCNESEGNSRKNHKIHSAPGTVQSLSQFIRMDEIVDAFPEISLKLLSCQKSIYVHGL